LEQALNYLQGKPVVTAKLVAEATEKTGKAATTGSAAASAAKPPAAPSTTKPAVK
jgi:carboxyl-terminal processing protease